MTGSSTRKLKRSNMDLLAGRAIPAVIHPFLAAEIGEQFILEESLNLGMIPLVLGAEWQRRLLRAT